ncbi:endo alpha-1,4 polygalactosaminidase, partial [Streptomyces massasporeus]
MIAREPRPLRSVRRRRLPALTLVGLLAVGAAGCTSSGDGGDGDSAPSSPPPSAARTVVPPEPHVGFDYQIGGPYAPPPGVGAVSRDRTAKPAEGLYNICYVNAFQAQPDATDWWEENHPDLLLRSAGGAPIVDQDWDEALFDVSTPAKRERLAAIVGECTRDGQLTIPTDCNTFADITDRTLTIRGFKVTLDARALSHDLTPELLGWTAGALPRA